MNNNLPLKSVNELLDATITKFNLPHRVFIHQFENYLFFDNDIGSADGLISTVQFIIKSCFNDNSHCEVFSSTDHAHLGSLDIMDDWVSKLNGIRKLMSEDRSSGSLIIIDAERRWAIYQYYPIDFGVLAFDSKKSLNSIKSLIDDYFVTCKDFEGWLSEQSERDIELTRIEGREFLTLLIRNYS